MHGNKLQIPRITPLKRNKNQMNNTATSTTINMMELPFGQQPSNHDDNDNHTNNEKELSREFSVVGSLLNRVAFLSFLTSFWKNIFVYVYDILTIYKKDVRYCVKMLIIM